MATRVQHLRRLGVATLALTFVLMVLGSWVKATGSGLACPDWPTCYGRWLPPFPSADNGGVDPATGRPVTYGSEQVMYEWAHRMVASLLAVPLLAFAALAIPSPAWADRVRIRPAIAWGGPPAVLGAILFLAALVPAATGATVPWRTLAALWVGGTAAAWFVAGPLNPIVRRASLRTPAPVGMGTLAATSLGVLAVQVLLGGVTVVGRNAAHLTTAHLATATLFAMLLTWATAIAHVRAPPVTKRYPGEEHGA